MSDKIQLTKAQEKAVFLRGHTMLVSAAAGSGKTAVLTKRIVELVTDTENPVDVSEILVVTYTKAAASELRERISSAIYNALKQDPGNKHLSNQLLKLGKAKISTIHSFCADLIKKNFQRIGLPANMRIADETETALLRNNILNELIDACYDGLYSDKIHSFSEFTENFLAAKKDERLPLVFSDIYSSLVAYPIGIEMLLESADELEKGAMSNILDTKWGEKIKLSVRRTFEEYIEKYDSACNYLMGAEKLCETYLPSFESDRRILYRLFSVLDGDCTYEALKDCFYGNEKLALGRTSSNYQTGESDICKGMREKFWKELGKVQKAFFTFSEDTVKKHFIQTAEVCRNMYGFLSVFEGLFREQKKNRGMLDYGDLETYALKLLYEDKACTKPTELAKSVKNKYKYIFIDEYQDVNELQDKIFVGISTPTNRFMVGDIKQSIYGFRGAEPGLFSSYRESFPECKPEGECPDSDGITLYLSNNFRSDRTVLDFSNAIFRVLFNNNSGKTPYTEGDRLICSKKYEEGEPDYPVRLCLMEENEEKGIINEAEFVADEIERLVKNGTDPSKIAILFRYRTKSIFFEEALKKRNISSFNQVDRDFFENDAVLLMLCLLNSIDNPCRDIYLAGTLKSPIFGFTMSELTEIRRYERSGSLFNALKKYAKDKADSKCLYFLKKLSGWRRFAEGCPVDKLVRHIYNETRIVELLSGRKTDDKDVERQANLLLLYEYARQFENGSFKGLYNFILFLNDVLEKRTALPNARLTSEGKGVVNIMTIHNSKGLEFDTVFFCGTSDKYNRSDESGVYIFHKDYGFTLKLRDKSTFGRFDTLPRNAARIAVREDEMDEELRCLYVALTRAKKRLIVTSCHKDPHKLVDEIKSPDSKVSYNEILNSNTVIEPLLWGILKSGYTDFSLEYIEPKAYTEGEENEVIEKIYDEKLIESYEQQIKERFSFEYPYGELTELPSKLAVSKLYPGILDEYTTQLETSAPSMYIKPGFLLPEEMRASAADKGTATHIFMQFCDFNSTASHGVKKEIERLESKGFIDKRNAGLVNISEVEAFFESELYDSLSKAKRVWRERRFNINLPASKFTENHDLRARIDGESVLVQGVIDLLYLDKDGKLVLADYKTDRFSKEEIESGEAESILTERHKTQLTYYAEACKRLFGRAVDKILIYSFALKKTVEIKEQTVEI